MLKEILTARTKPSDKALYNIWARKLSSGWAETTITGSLPLTFQAQKAEALTDYTVYGTSAGAGARTENKFDWNTVTTGQRIIWSTGEDYANEDAVRSDYIAVVYGETYTCTNQIYLLGYDSNKNYIGAYDTSLNAFSLQEPSQNYNLSSFVINEANCAYIKIMSYYSGQTPLSNDTMLVSGSTAPSNYIPYGYQIPLTNTSGVTKNLWDENYENISFNLTYKSINVGDGEFTLSTTAPIYSGSCCLFLMAGQQTSGATTSSDGASANLSRTVTSVGGYVTVVYRKYGTVDPREYKTMLNKGSTALSYIPHRYTADYNLYIGDSKLGEEEYVDYAEGKVYKRTEQLFNKDDFILADLSLYNETKITSSTTDCIIVMPCEANTQYVISIPNYDSTVWRIGLSDYEIPASNQEYTRIESEKPSGNVSTFTTLATTKNILLQIQKTTVDITKNSIMLVSGSTAPAQYIPYIQPTDPPSPFPAIAAYEGENTLSSTETVGSVSVSGKIKEVTP